MIEIFVTLVGITILVLGLVISEPLPIDTKIAVLTLSTATFVMSIITAVYIDHKNGKYVCKNCGKEFKPTLKEYIFSTHMFSTRHLKCPHCGEKSWCKSCKEE